MALGKFIAHMLYCKGEFGIETGKSVKKFWQIMFFFTFIGITSSSGCGQILPRDVSPGLTSHRNVQQTDSDIRLGTYAREYLIHLPLNYDTHTRYPLFFFFHGWGGSFNLTGTKFEAESDRNGYILISPNGMADGVDMRSWNVGQAGRTDICVHKDVTEYEYSSCIETKNTSICNCGTCYDDVKFVMDMFATLNDELCIDHNKIYASGASFGALFVYFLAPELPRRRANFSIRALLPWYGAFYRHMTEIQHRTSVFHFHGIHDKEIPIDGTEGQDGYIYDTVNSTLDNYASTNGCNSKPRVIVTPFDGKHDLISCVEWIDCREGRIVRCYFDGGHGIWPYYSENMMWWFLKSLS